MTRPNSNFFISHFYFIFQFTFLSYLYSKLIRDKLFNKIIAVVYFSQILILGYMYVSNPSLFWKFNEYEIIATSLILVFYALYFIYKEIDKVHSVRFQENSSISLLISGIHQYLSGSPALHQIQYK